MSLFFCRILRQPTITLFPYTTLFRSRLRAANRGSEGGGRSGRYRCASRRRVQPRMAYPSQRERGHTDGKQRSEEHTSELQSPDHLVCRLLLEKKKPRTLLECRCSAMR